jgi:peptidoglycan/LPS O-acetylase OafA/YrhL
LDAIAAGILIAALLRGRMPKLRVVYRLAMLCTGIATLSLVANYWRTNDPESLQWVPTLAGFPSVAASCTLILIAVLGVSFHLPRWLVYLGKISYALYVYHALGMVPADQPMPTHTHFRQLVLRETISLAAAGSLASASYTLLEKPFLRIKKRFQLIGSRPVQSCAVRCSKNRRKFIWYSH